MPTIAAAIATDIAGGSTSVRNAALAAIASAGIVHESRGSYGKSWGPARKNRICSVLQATSASMRSGRRQGAWPVLSRLRMSPVLIDSPELLADHAARWAKAPWLALDTEFVRVDTYFPKLCLIQVADGASSVCVAGGG